MTKAAHGIRTEKFETLIQKFSGDRFISNETDILAVEEPLEIRLGLTKNDKFQHQPVSITMRTPGNDFELAAGFLLTENILSSREQILSIKHCGKFPAAQNTVRIDLKPGTNVDLKRLERNFYTTSSCGVCGKTSLEALSMTGAKKIEKNNFSRISAGTIHQFPVKLRAAQTVFDETGGLHAAALFDVGGNLLSLREDVGRHNAVDKLIGAEFLANRLPLDEKILFLSGRASFELIQKAVMAGIPMVCAVGAPSSLTVEAAREFNISLLGFVRDHRFNVYSGVERLEY